MGSVLELINYVVEAFVQMDKREPKPRITAPGRDKFQPCHAFQSKQQRIRELFGSESDSDLSDCEGDEDGAGI